MRDANIAIAGLGLAVCTAVSGRADVIDFESGFIDRMRFQPAGHVDQPGHDHGRRGRTGEARSSPRSGPPSRPSPRRSARRRVPQRFLLPDRRARRAGRRAELPPEFRPAGRQPRPRRVRLPCQGRRPKVGDSVTLTAFGDAAGTKVVGTQSYKINDLNLPNGFIESLAVMKPYSPILSASVTFSRGDVGTGIDNIAFTTDAPVPEPSSLIVLIAGLLGVVGLDRHRRPSSSAQVPSPGRLTSGICDPDN